MQAFHFDLSTKSIAPVLNVKQGDVGRKFQAVITDRGVDYNIPAGAQFSVWFSGPSGEGNYSAIGERSAFTVDGNTVTVELIAQMLQNPGTGAMCLVLNAVDGSQIGLWNVIYSVEAVPGMGSKTAQEYYTALSELARQAIEAAATFETDTTFSASGKAADAAATGAALAGKAPAGYGLGTFSQMVDNPDNITNAGFYQCLLDITGTALNYYLIHQTHAHTYMHQIAIRVVDGFELHRTKADGTWGPWEYVNPPMVLGVEYRTTERWQGKAVYTKLIDFGALPNASEKTVSHATGATSVLRVSGLTDWGWTIPYKRSDGREVRISATSTAVVIVTGTNVSEQLATVQLWYVKD